jgi:hypothetical protein
LIVTERRQVLVQRQPCIYSNRSRKNNNIKMNLNIKTIILSTAAFLALIGSLTAATIDQFPYSDQHKVWKNGDFHTARSFMGSHALSLHWSGDRYTADNSWLVYDRDHKVFYVRVQDNSGDVFWFGPVYSGGGSSSYSDDKPFSYQVPAYKNGQFWTAGVPSFFLSHSVSLNYDFGLGAYYVPGAQLDYNMSNRGWYITLPDGSSYGPLGR